MKINFMRTLIVSLCLIILHGCSFNDLTDLLSDEDTSESEIVIREIQQNHLTRKILKKFL